jgi:hypothetical protein
MFTALKLMPLLDREGQQTIIKLFEQYGPQLESIETGAAPIDEGTIRAIVAEQRHGVSAPVSMTVQKKEAKAPPAVREQKPMRDDRSPQTRIFDSMVDAMVGGPNDTSKLR